MLDDERHLKPENLKSDSSLAAGRARLAAGLPEACSIYKTEPLLFLLTRGFQERFATLMPITRELSLLAS